MVGSSILPVSFHRGKLYFLFGKENELEQSARGFSDFGGGMESGESAFETACREGAEELTGFLGDSAKIRALSRRHLKLGDPEKYNIHIVRVDYDPKLPDYYNNNHRFLWNRMDKQLLSRTKLFEKIEIQWFSATDARRRLREFRPFYAEILKEHVLTPTALSQIRQFLRARARGATRKVRSSGAPRTKRRRYV